MSANDNVVGHAQSFTPETLAARWQCSAQHIRDLVAKGELPSFRVGRLIRISVESVQELECQRSDRNSFGAHGMLSGPMIPVKLNVAPSAPRIVKRPNVG
ncbi:helix-turn-helix domain-containing protein [Mesorhizobium sp. A556]